MKKKQKSNSLLKSAIADAKAVRETALANARVALEEAFTPHLTSMLSKKLKHEDAMADMGDEELDEETGLSGVDIRDPDVEDAHGPGSGAEGRTAGGKELISKDAVSEDLDTSDIGRGDNKEPSKDAWDSAETDNDDEEERAFQDVSEHTEPGEEVDDFAFGKDKEQDQDLTTEDEEFGDDDEDLDEEHGLSGPDLDIEKTKSHDIDMGIDEILRELEADTMDSDDDEEFADDEGLGDDEGMGDEEGLEGDAHDGDEEFGGNLGDEDEQYGDDLNADEEENLYEDEEDKMGSSNATDAETEQNLGQVVDPGEALDEEEEVDLSELVKQIHEEEDDLDEVRPSKTLKHENKSLKRNLKEYRQAVKFLRSKLLEVNLLNAKLLYTNKLFKNYNMNVGQKMRVVETFDRATTLRETKLVYATLAESFNSAVTPKFSGKKTITEGLASRAIGSTKPKGPAARKVLNEGTDMAARFRKLAGITRR